MNFPNETFISNLIKCVLIFCALYNLRHFMWPSSHRLPTTNGHNFIFCSCECARRKKCKLVLAGGLNSIYSRCFHTQRREWNKYWITVSFPESCRRAQSHTYTNPWAFPSCSLLQITLYVWEPLVLRPTHTSPFDTWELQSPVSHENN